MVGFSSWCATELRILRAALSGRDEGVRFVTAHLNFSLRKIQMVEESYSEKNFPQELVSFTNFENASQNFSKFTHVFWCVRFNFDLSTFHPQISQSFLNF